MNNVIDYIADSWLEQRKLLAKAYFPCPLPFIDVRIKVALKGKWIGLKQMLGQTWDHKIKILLYALVCMVRVLNKLVS